jgi:1-acyl-sn-glycerol-3-phosphate acyltransferase
MGVASSRGRLASLWLSQCCRITADNVLRAYVVLQFTLSPGGPHDSGWELATALLMWPAIVLAPFNGAICNSLPKPKVLVGAAAYGLLVTALFAVMNTEWMWGWGLLALGTAIYGPMRYAMLPAASIDTHWPLTRINSLFETGSAAGIVVGPFAALLLVGQAWLGWPAPVTLVVLLNALALLFALPVRFPSDVVRYEAPLQAVRGFFSDVRVIWKEREARWCLIGLGGLRGAITGLTGALLASSLPRLGDDPLGWLRNELLPIAGAVMGGMAVGSFLAGWQRHPRRILSFVPVGAIGLAFAFLLSASGEVPSLILCAVFGFMAGLINVPLAATYQASLPPDARGNGMAIRNFADYVCIALAAVLLFALARLGLSPSQRLWLIAGVTGLGAVAACVLFRREFLEQLVEFVFAVMYRFRAAGPGLDTFPTRGPVLIVANHSAWMDPMWLAKVLPRTVTPMMTSAFFDIPIMRWLMVHVIQAIRVETGHLRRETPEIDEAVNRLKDGRCVLIFPEGMLRRSEERPLKMFGQGVWRILQQCPDIPVVVCWIEGGWGSYFSYFNGPPTKNKKMDRRHLVQISVGASETIPPDVLQDQRRTRLYFMQKCAALRSELGLPAVVLTQEAEGKES